MKKKLRTTSLKQNLRVFIKKSVFAAIDSIVELSNNWEMSVFSLLLLSHKVSVTNSVDMCEIRVFIGGTELTWLEWIVPCESPFSFCHEFLSLSEILKCI